jgi:3'-phosphoadenosine 5'-phosphosulfate sulfotransferase (PAPS reductase)/FAD synthetase
MTRHEAHGPHGGAPRSVQGVLFPAATTVPDLASYHVLLANISAGKDSQAMLDELVCQADRQGVSRSRIVTVFADLGDQDEWPGTRELAAEHAACYGLRHQVVCREITGEDGERVAESLSEHIEARGMWPDAARRYCTSDLKRAPVYRLMTRLAAEQHAAGVTGRVRILNVMGLRDQESRHRAAMAAFSHDERATNQTVRHVDQWLPIHGWDVTRVWARIREADTRPHPVYAAGLPRLSCRFCVLASESALLRAAQLDPQGARRRADMEQRMGHQFRLGLPMRAIIARAQGSPAAVPVTGWEA